MREESTGAGRWDLLVGMQEYRGGKAVWSQSSRLLTVVACGEGLGVLQRKRLSWARKGWAWGASWRAQQESR